MTETSAPLTWPHETGQITGSGVTRKRVGTGTERAALAEALAKAVVIRGSEWGAGLLGHSDVLGTVVLRRTGEVLVSEEVLPWLA